MKALLSPSNTISTSLQEQELVSFDRSGLYSEKSLLQSEPSFIKLESINDDSDTIPTTSSQQLEMDENNSLLQSLNLTNSSQFWRDFFNSSSSSIAEIVQDHSSSIIEEPQKETSEVDNSTTVTSSISNGTSSISDNSPLHVHPPPLSRFPLLSPAVVSDHELPEVSFKDETDTELMYELMRELDSMTDMSLFTAPPSCQIPFADDLSTQFVKDLNLSNFSSSNNTLEGEPSNHFNLPNISLPPSQDNTINCSACKKGKSSPTPSQMTPSLSFQLFSPLNVHACSSQMQSSSSPELFKNWSASHIISNSTDTGIVADATPLPTLSFIAPTSSITGTSVPSYSITSIATTMNFSSYTSTPVIHLQRAPTRLWQQRVKERERSGKDCKQVVPSLPRKRRLDTLKLSDDPSDTRTDNGATSNYTESSKTQKKSKEESPELF